VGSSWLDLLRNAFFIGGIVAFTWIGIQRGQIRGLKDSVDGLRGDRDDRDKRLADRDAAMLVERNQRAAERASDLSKIASLEAAVETLRATVTGEAHLVALEGSLAGMADALAAHHADAMSGIDKIEAALVRVEKALGPRGLS
jgi:hypothetical protein